jgi:hypothetical protein
MKEPPSFGNRGFSKEDIEDFKSECISDTPQSKGPESFGAMIRDDEREQRKRDLMNSRF